MSANIDLQQLARELTSHVNARISGVEFALNGPATLTCAMRDASKEGQFRKRPFWGGEPFRFQSVRAGKSSIIACFAPARLSVDVKWVEIPVSKVGEHFAPIVAEAFEDFLQGHDASVVAVVTQRSEAESLAGFGSW